MLMPPVHRHTELVVPPVNPLLRRTYRSGGLRNRILWSGALYFQFLFSFSFQAGLGMVTIRDTTDDSFINLKLMGF